MSPTKTWLLLAVAVLIQVPSLAQSRAGSPVLDATVHVRVTSEGTGEPVEEVWVWAGRKRFGGEHDRFPFGLSGSDVAARRAYVEMDGVGALAATPASGELELHVPSGTVLWIAIIQDGGEQKRLDPLVPGERVEVTFDVRSGRTRYQGLVLEREGGKPVAGAQVVGIERDNEVSAKTTTDDAGRFRIEMGDTLPEARISAPGFGLTVGPLTAGHADPAQPLVFWLDRAATLRARVLALDGQPVAGATVRCMVEIDHLLQPDPMPEYFIMPAPGRLETWETTTDASGRCEFIGLPPRAWLTVELGDPGLWRSELVALAPGEQRELSIVPAARVTLGGSAVDQDGRPAAGLTLRARRLALPDCEQVVVCTTAADGSFLFAGLEPGSWFLGPVSNPEDLGFARVEQRVEVPVEPREQELVLRLERGLFLSGRVREDDDHNGSPVRGAHAPRVEARTLDGCFAREAWCEEGRFTIGPLPAGEYELCVSRQGRFTCDPVRARAGATDLELPLPALVGELAFGAVNGHDAFETSRIFPRERPDMSSIAYFCLGSCLREHLEFEHGLYDAVVTTDDRRLGRAEGVAPTPEGTITSVELQPCATLRLIWTGPELHALVIARVGDAVYASEIATQHAACGLFAPPGKVRLELFPMNARNAVPVGPPHVREVTLALGEEPEVLVP